MSSSSVLSRHDRCPAGSYGWPPLIATAALFFLIGFVTWLNGPLIAFVRVAFSLSDTGAFLVPFVFYLSYLFFALPAAWITDKMGLRRGLALALAIMSIGTALFGQFVAARSYSGALAGLLVLGCGLTQLQVTVNPYVSLLGPHDRAAQRIAIMGLCNKCAGILAPIVLAALVMRDIGGVVEAAQNAPSAAARGIILSGFAQAIYLPYLIMAGTLFLASLAVAFSQLPDPVCPDGNALSSSRFSMSPRLTFGILTTFLYVGVEVLAGDAIGTYGQGFGLPLEQTRFFTAFTLTGMMVGYVLGLVCVPRFLSQQHAMMLSSLAGVFFALTALFTHGYLSVLCVAFLGLANAMIMPALFPMAIRDSGPHVARASALLVMAFSGGAFVPQIFALLKPLIGFQDAFTALALTAYVIILFYNLIFGGEKI
ncbi:glucose/galactose MFS transporter [Acetobacter estunensis]|uniref:glucose/galactose MFS transporter n=1 Tax=Acetobacter estunensis TaxID=104097 RepID=UPI001C2D565C|nr:glucose/galactose MFS transporter [Acetobacter estunensis]